MPRVSSGTASDRVGDSSYWDWYDQFLAHPEGPALGGEPCIGCGEPIPLTAHPKQKQRHVCSPRCNDNYKRRMRRRMKREGIEPPPLVDPYAGRAPRLFATTDDDAVPYEFLGWGPVIGDIVERDGSATTYLPVIDPASGAPVDGAQLVVHLNTGSVTLRSRPRRSDTIPVIWGIWGPDTEDLQHERHFQHDSLEWTWGHETITDVDGEGRPYRWQAWVCVAGEPADLWTPAYWDYSARLHRISSSTARHARRQRLRNNAGGWDRIDPLEIYERDGWSCQICGEPIPREARHPEPLSASLDHILPIAAGGGHRTDNVQASHLRCNLRKGVIVDPELIAQRCGHAQSSAPGTPRGTAPG